MGVTIRTDEAARLRALLADAFRPGLERDDATAALCRLAGHLEAVLDRAEGDEERQARLPGT